MAEPQTSETTPETTSDTATGNAGSGFQRPQAPQAATPQPRTPFGAPSYGNFGPAPAANAPSSTPAVAASYTPYNASASNGRRLVIGEGIAMSGDIEACENLVVEGTVDASLRGAKNLEITQTGVFYGSVEIDEATVAGRFEGDLKVNGRLTVRASGSIIGSVSYKELAIEPGALIDGRISPLTSLQSSQDGKKSTGKGRVAAASFGKSSEKDNSESLFTRNRPSAAE